MILTQSNIVTTPPPTVRAPARAHRWWALPLAARNTNRISRAHLECAATGEGHEALHDLLCSFDEKHLERLSRIGHSSGLDAAAGALLALQAAAGTAWRARQDESGHWQKTIPI